jgi:carboxylesterase type B
MTAISLYQIAADHRRMVESLLATDNDEQTIADTIEAESFPLEVKAQNVAYAIRTLEANAAAIKEAEKQMAERRKAMENRATHIKEYLKTCMEIAGVTKMECPHFALTIRSNPPSVEVYEPSLVPTQFMKTPEPPPPAPDKTAIKDAIKAGEEVPGAQLVQGKRLEIR